MGDTHTVLRDLCTISIGGEGKPTHLSWSWTTSRLLIHHSVKGKRQERNSEKHHYQNNSLSISFAIPSSPYYLPSFLSSPSGLLAFHVPLEGDTLTSDVTRAVVRLTPSLLATYPLQATDVCFLGTPAIKFIEDQEESFGEDTVRFFACQFTL